MNKILALIRLNKSLRATFILLVLVCPLQFAGAQSAEQVCLYSEKNYSGNEYCATSSIGFVTLNFKTASIRLPIGYQLTAYSLPFYFGPSHSLTTSVADFEQLNGNVRSFKLEEKSFDIASLVSIISFFLSENIDPNDLDGDGFDNALEEEYGTDPNDSNSTPPDLDGDKIPDDRDDDRDGDGVSNTLEQELGTDPDNVDDFPDLVAPTLIVNNGQSIRLVGDSIIVTGNAIDTEQIYSGFEAIYITSFAFENTRFTGARDDVSGDFSIEVPLVLGENTLTITATDKSDNATTQLVTVTRSSIPVIESVTPVNGTVVTTDVVTITGVIRTNLPSDGFSVQVNNSRLSTNSTGQPDLYEFSFLNVPLSLGVNAFDFRVDSEFGGDHEVVQITYMPEASEELAPPIIRSVIPVDGKSMQTASFRVGAQIESSGGPLSVSVNGNEVLSQSSGQTFYSLNEVVSFNAQSSSIGVSIQATDSLSKTTQHNVTYYRDSVEPEIVLDQAYEPTPSVVMVDTATVRFSGVVSDESLSSLMVNNQSIRLSPGDTEGRYRFQFTLPLTNGEPLPVEFEAYDRSGNVKRIVYSVLNDASSSINAILPPPDSTFLAGSEPIILQIAARVSGISTNDTVVAYLSSNGPASAQPLVINGSLASGDLLVPNAEGQYTIVFENRNAQGQRINSDSLNVEVKDRENIAVELQRIEPSSNEKYIEPNARVEVYFNQAVELADVDVIVKETLHGKSYLNADPLGEDFLNAKGYVLSTVNRDMELVPGQLSSIPGKSGVVYAPNRNLGFNSDVFVEVIHDGETLSRTRFKVRELPTFINGAVVDQFGQPLSGIQVQIPELSRVTTTNGDGGFAFGYQERGDQVIPSGSYKILLNSNFKNRTFGTRSSIANVLRNRVNVLPRYNLQELNSDIPFFNLSSAQANNLLGGELIVDLTDARAIFPNSRTSGPVHAQFLPFEHIGAESTPYAMSHWAFGVQPKGIAIEGNAKITLKVPMLRGSYDYIDSSSYQYVVLLGYSQIGQVFEPIGVGKVENRFVKSVGSLHLKSLDYLGYAQVLPSLNNELEKYANGELSLLQLKAILQAQYKEQ